MKKVLIGLAVVVVLIVGGVVLLLSNLDKIVETAIETAGTSAIGSQVEVGSVELNLTGGTAAIHGFSIANPEGYSTAEMVSFDELSVSINIQDTSGQNVHINSVVARSPHVLYETIDGVSNLDAVSARFESDESDADSAEATDIMLVIDSIEIEDIQGTLISDLLGDPIDVDLGDVSLSDLEGNPDELAKQIIQPLISQIGVAAARALVQATTQMLSDAAGEVGEQIQDAGERLQDVSDQASEALESVGNLFNRD